ncbi:hypothetical protein [Pantoea sp. ME81]|uniref:hypothetical protein n=1 Tax=Pantoea sp. ME81 TaxID=2743935 RepID=UPI0015F76721|nr:hypothetical protein [Pantoea sp. ME81]
MAEHQANGTQKAILQSDHKLTTGFTTLAGVHPSVFPAYSDDIALKKGSVNRQDPERRLQSAFSVQLRF